MLTFRTTPTCGSGVGSEIGHIIIMKMEMDKSRKESSLSRELGVLCRFRDSSIVDVKFPLISIPTEEIDICRGLVLE